MVARVAPEAATGGPIGLTYDGDVVRIDATARALELEIDAAELAKRREKWSPPRRATRPACSRSARRS